jgi:hypothetical protein
MAERLVVDGARARTTLASRLAFETIVSNYLVWCDIGDRLVITRFPIRWRHVRSERAAKTTL